MRRLYLDTSLLVASLVHEAGTAAAVGFLQAHAQQPLLISAWVSTELASALALLERRGAITPQESQEAWQRFGVLRANRLQDLPLHQTISRPLRVSVWLKPPCGQGMLCIWLSANG